MNQNALNVKKYADGKRSHQEIADLVGMSRSGVKKIMLRYGFPSRPEGGRPGADNHQFSGGRRIGLDGYALVTAPVGHESGRPRPNRPGGHIIAEHRLIVEQKLGRYLKRGEVVDHIDGLTLHNSPDNLRVFPSNAEHLKATLAEPPKISASGMRNVGTRSDLGKEYQPVDTYRLRRARGDVRLRQILLLWLSPGIDDQYPSGTQRWLLKAGISDHSRSSLEHALAQLYLRYEADLSR